MLPPKDKPQTPFNKPTETWIAEHRKLFAKSLHPDLFTTNVESRIIAGELIANANTALDILKKGQNVWNRKTSSRDEGLPFIGVNIPRSRDKFKIGTPTEFVQNLSDFLNSGDKKVPKILAPETKVEAPITKDAWKTIIEKRIREADQARRMKEQKEREARIQKEKEDRERLEKENFLKKLNAAKLAFSGLCGQFSITSLNLSDIENVEKNGNKKKEVCCPNCEYSFLI
jgi:hypothetical protein